jgi:hypothetical protein
VTTDPIDNGEKPTPIAPHVRKRDMYGRWTSKNPKPAPDFNVISACFLQQKNFITDPAPFITASCSRRAGKSVACAHDLVGTALANDGVVCGYITLTSRMAKNILWRELQKINNRYHLGAKFNINELSMTLPNDSIIRLAGCANESEVDKFLGVPLKLLYLDEVQSFRAHIGELIDRAIAPSLMDYNGKLKLIGTPAMLKSGYFWDALQSDAYSHHSWTYWDNPFIPQTSGKTHEELLHRELKRRGVAVTDPSIRREWFGEWINDDNARVFQYQASVNNYNELPPLDEYVIAVDVGFHDADAIAVLGWPKHDRRVYLVDEIVTPQQGVTDLAAQIELLVARYKPLKIVMDTGGLGKKIAEELRKRFSLPIQAAEKTRKIEYIELVNDALRTGSLLVREKSRFAIDSYVVEWDHNKSTPDRRVIKSEPHSDICDAVLYAYREALHWLAEPAKVPLKLTSREAWIAHSLKMAEDNLQKQIDQQDEDKRFEMEMAAVFE